MLVARLMIFRREVGFMGMQKSCKLEVNRLRNRNFNSVELYLGLCQETIFNITEYFKLVKN